MAQAVVKGPIGEEATVLGTTGHQVFRWLWLQCCGTRGLCQGFVACGQTAEGSGREAGRGWIPPLRFLLGSWEDRIGSAPPVL